MELIQRLIPNSKHSKKAPYSMAPIGVVIHNTANDASAANEISYMTNNNNATSFHIAVDDKEAIQAIPFNRNTWNAGDGGKGIGNRRYIAIEICYSKSGGIRFTKAERNAAKVTARILKQFNWTTADVRRHMDFSGKNCPHRTMQLGWNRFLRMVEEYMSTPAYYSRKTNNRHPLVRVLQQDLKDLGYTVAVDGSFGLETENAIKAFQKANKLTADGLAGAATLAKVAQLKAKMKQQNTNGTLYRVQVGVFGDKRNAEKMVEDLKKKGFTAIIN